MPLLLKNISLLLFLPLVDNDGYWSDDMFGVYWSPCCGVWNDITGKSLALLSTAKSLAGRNVERKKYEMEKGNFS